MSKDIDLRASFNKLSKETEQQELDPRIIGLIRLLARSVATKDYDLIAKSGINQSQTPDPMS